MHPSEPFPVTAARDLLGILRTLLVLEKSHKMGRDEKQIAALTEACTLLSEAITLAAESTRAGTLGERAAWSRAERVDMLLRDSADSFGATKRLILAGSANLRSGGIKRI